MDISPTIKIFLAVASAEANFTRSRGLEPEHFFLALLKIEDLLGTRISLEGVSEGKAKEVEQEIAELVEFWKEQKIPCKRMRRRLRGLVVEHQQETGEFEGHRSERGRKLFRNAEAIAHGRGEKRLTLKTMLIACLRFESPVLDEIFQEFGVKAESLLHALEVSGKDDARERSLEGNGQGQPRLHPLARYGRDLTALAHTGKLGPIIGRHEEIKTIARILAQRSKNNPLLLGDPGVGKTAVVEGLALFAAQEAAPEFLRKLHFVEISMSALLAGTMYRGEFEERLQEVVETARKEKDLILFVDEIHTLMGAGAGGSSTLDAANILKPVLARGDIRCIGATTIDEYRRHIEPDGALARRFQIVWVNEPTPPETLEILSGLRPKMQEHHQMIIPDEVIEKAVALSNRYLTEGYQPDKAITVLDEACARRKLLTIHARPAEQQTSVLEVEDVAQVIARKTQIPLEVILASDEERLLAIEQELAKRVIGQDHALRAVAQAIRISRAGLRAPGKPVVLLFAGPSGTGKSELAKALSEFLFFDPQRLITLDMSEYQESHSVSKLIGSPPGYVGFGEEPYLIRELRLHPYSVVLLDEIEKAHPSVLTIFLQIFDEGRLTDARGRRIHCGDAIFILTSNLGVSAVKPKAPLGFKLGRTEQEDEMQVLLEEQVRQALMAGLRPELLNRIQEVVIFNYLSQETLYKILDIYTAGLAKQLETRQIGISLDNSAKDFLIQVGYRPEYGARHLRRAFDRWVTEPLSREILAGNLQNGQQVAFVCQEDRLVLNIQSTHGIITIVYQPIEEDLDNSRI